MSDHRAIEVQELHKHFGETRAVRGLTFDVAEGEIFSLLGPNGAGKSTTISMMAGLLEPTEGDVRLMGRSIRREPMAVRAMIGVVPQEIALYGDLSARENLAFWGKMYGLRGAALRRRVDEVLEIIGLADRQKGPAAHFSGGMKRRLNVGIALLHRPKVLILDEPTVGIDPQSRRHILNNIKALNQQGMTVLYTTHYMEEAQELSHRIGIMDQGQMIAQGSHAELVQTVGELDRVDLAIDGPIERVSESWQAIQGVSKVSAMDGPADGQEGGAGGDGAARKLSLLVEDSNLVLPRLFESAAPLGARITSVDIHEPNLETVFLHLTGRALRD